MYCDRLLMLRDRLRDVHEQHLYFSMRNWFVPETDIINGVKIKCGTASCALGHASLIPALNELGLTGGGGSPIYYDPLTKRFSAGFTAGADIFGLTNRQSRYLFDEEHYWPAGAPIASEEKVTALEVANRITDFVACGGLVGAAA